MIQRILCSLLFLCVGGCLSRHPTVGSQADVSGREWLAFVGAKKYAKTLRYLKRWEGKALWDVSQDEEERIRNVVDRLRHPDLSAAFICELRDAVGYTALFFIEANEQYILPSEARIRVTSLDPQGDVPPSVYEFSAGWRTFVSRFEVQTNKCADVGDLLVITMDSGLKEYYGLNPCDGEPVLVRLESPGGGPLYTANVYGDTILHETIGPNEWDCASMTTWKETMSTGPSVALLGGLLYLQGTHLWSEDQKRYHLDESEVVRCLVREGIDQKLLHHTNEWVRESAASLFKPNSNVKAGGSAGSGVTSQ
jgi:hypothetical protein